MGGMGEIFAQAKKLFNANKKERERKRSGDLISVYGEDSVICVGKKLYFCFQGWRTFR